MAFLRGVNKLDALPPQATSLAAKAPGEMNSSLNLYDILCYAGNTTNSLNDFAGTLERTLDAQLGSGNYVCSLALAKDGHSSGYSIHGNKLPNVNLWCGDAGILPGPVSSYFVMLTVFTA
jgi:hypothetical protein